MTPEEKQNQEKIKALFIEQLKKTPVVQVVCEKIQIGKSSIYRWKKSDKEFKKAVDEAMSEGTDYISDMAESRLIEAIRDRNLRAVFFWLKSHSNRYSTKVEINGRLKMENEPLTQDQQDLIKKALEYSGLLNDKK